MSSFIVDGETVTCCHGDCGISFQVPDWWANGKRETHNSFYCPNGHRQHFNSETDAEIFRRERDIAKQQLARAEQDTAEARAAARKAELKVKKIKKRAAAGTCPCCQRTFQNMAIHMRKQHPSFVAGQVTKLQVVK